MMKAGHYAYGPLIGVSALVAQCIYPTVILFEARLNKEVKFERKRWRSFNRRHTARNALNQKRALVKRSNPRYTLITKCLHFSDNDKQVLPNTKSNQPLAASKQPLTDFKLLPADNQEESVTTTAIKELRLGGEGPEVGGKSVDAKVKQLCDPPATSGTIPNPNIMAKALTEKIIPTVLNLLEGFGCLDTVRLTRKNIPEDVKKIKKNCKKGTIIARHSGDIMVLVWKNTQIVSMISTFHNDRIYTGTRAGEECEKSIYVKNYKLGALI
ncbi:PiggyBac transposable element-derived protein 4 [Eumeta japonica]|uniref:PiggyBac transposable element-derived protein 4 n=1 Tax=Eumeta variegata TaxID=151549 RepID=A0A4C1UXW3_EUMVA|nr:PiggyBac transposable element-derived protein 4 [Eumeta japonica]